MPNSNDGKCAASGPRTIANAPVITVGGLFNQPDYPAAYLTAARRLMAAGNLQTLAVPIVYLQRHTVELMLKTILTGAYGVIESTQRLQRAKCEPVLPFQIKSTMGHKLGQLLADAEAALAALGFNPPEVPGMRGLVRLIESLEGGDETRWRYDRVVSGDHSFGLGFPQGAKGEVTLPIGEIQESLEQISDAEQVGRWEEALEPGGKVTGIALSLAMWEHGLDQQLFERGLL